MSSKTICLALTVGLAVASISLNPDRNKFRRRGGGATIALKGPYDYAGPGGVYGPGFTGSYIYVPGHGILDAPCPGLPTSACPNSQRPVD